MVVQEHTPVKGAHGIRRYRQPGAYRGKIGLMGEGTRMINRLKATARDIAERLRVYRAIMGDERTPWLAKVCIGAAIAYAISPIDLVPDWIPVIGYLDDLVVVPLLLWIGLRLVPEEVIRACERRAGAGGTAP